MSVHFPCRVTYSHSHRAELESASAQTPSRQRLAKPKSQANFNSLASPGVRRMSSGQAPAFPHPLALQGKHKRSLGMSPTVTLCATAGGVQLL